MKTKKMKQKKKFSSRLLTVILTFVMICGLMPTMTFAETTITSVDVSDINLPYIGETPDYNGTLPKNAPYHFATDDELSSLGYDLNKAKNGIIWLKEGEMMSLNDRFVAGSNYRCMIILVSASGYTFTNLTFCSINNNSILVARQHSSGPNGYFESDFLTAKEPVAINSVDVSNITVVAGEKPNYNPTLPKGAHYHMASTKELNEMGIATPMELVNGMVWNEENASSNMKPDESFVAGNKYYFQVMLIPNSGYVFADKPTFKINHDTKLVNDNSGSYHSISSLLSNPIEPELAATKSVTAKLSAYNAVKVTWPAVSGATGYKVYYRNASGKETYKGSTKSTSMNLANLPAGAKCSVKVVPYRESNGKTITAKATTSSTLYTLKKLSKPTVSKKSRKSITVKWTNIAGETGYQISKSTKKTKTGTRYTVKTTTGKSKTLKVKRRKNYYYKVRAYKTVDGKKIYGPWSSVKSYRLK